MFCKERIKLFKLQSILKTMGKVVFVPDEYEIEVEKMVKKIKDKFGIKIPKAKASRIILLKSKSTTYDLTEAELIKILGS